MDYWLLAGWRGPLGCSEVQRHRARLSSRSMMGVSTMSKLPISPHHIRGLSGVGWVSRSAAWWWWWWGEPLCTLVNPDKLSSMDAIPVTLQTREGRDIRKCLLLVYIDRQELALLSHTSASSPHSPSSKQGSAIGYGAATNLVKMVHAAFVFFQEKSRNKEEVNHSLQ